MLDMRTIRIAFPKKPWFSDWSDVGTQATFKAPILRPKKSSKELQIQIDELLQKEFIDQVCYYGVPQSYLWKDT